LSKQQLQAIKNLENKRFRSKAQTEAEQMKFGDGQAYCRSND
jgi:hypothetical protein